MLLVQTPPIAFYYLKAPVQPPYLDVLSRVGIVGPANHLGWLECAVAAPLFGGRASRCYFAVLVPEEIMGALALC